jgi:O-antigen/teichoic acid export membrane protein
VALTESESATALPAKLSLADVRNRIKIWLADHGHESLAQRVAGTAFLIRIAGAVLAYLSQVVLARWMGSFEFGIYVYVWTWVLLIGGLADLGLASGAQRFIPKYASDKADAHLRGFLTGSRWVAFGTATAVGLLGVLGVWLLAPWIDDYTIVPLYLGCISLPICGVLHTQDAISRSYNWVNLALLPQYVVRQLVLVALLGLAYLAGFKADATTTVVLGGLAMWIAAFGQMILLNRRLRRAIAPGPKSYEVSHWLATSMPIKLVESFYLILMYTDVIILSQFRTPDEIAVYYAAGKTLSFVSFVYFSVSAAASHRYTEYHVAGERERLADFIAASVRWTFWPSLAGTALILLFGWPLLWLFGPRFVEGYQLMFILAIGILARAAVGPGERLLNMLGEQKACTIVVAVTFAFNLAACLILIPHYGATGAAIAASAAFVLESILLFIVTKHQVGFHIFIWGRPERR